MRRTAVLLVVMLALGVGVLLSFKDQRSNASAAKFFSPSKHSSPPDFDSQIKPIFQARCQPCHFQGGKMHDELPFDKAETITKLGTKLFTRIKDEKEKQLIREFLESSNAEKKNR
jgi:hypothetical protein